MTPCEAAAYALGAALLAGGGGLAAYELGRRSGRREGRPDGRRFDPAALTEPTPRRAPTGAGETMAESRRTLKTRIAAERQRIAAERDGDAKKGPP